MRRQKLVFNKHHENWIHAMKIILHARSFFEARLGTRTEAKLLRDCRIISINDVTHHPEPPPFSERFFSSPNLLTLFFDDVEQEGPAAFSTEQAEEVICFALHSQGHQLHIHCTAGISRSAAIGMFIADKLYDCLEQFKQDNHDIQANVFVLHRLEETLREIRGKK